MIGPGFNEWTIRQRIQRAIAFVLDTIGLDELAYDVATYSRSGHVCWSCGQRSHTERVHLGHLCVVAPPRSGE